MPQRIWTISNAISALRAVIALPLAWLLLSGQPSHRMAAVWLILFGVATDFLDGYLARRLHQVTDLGKIIDPLADKIAVGTVAVILGLVGDIPLWYLAAVLVRDALILAGGLYIRSRKRIVPQSNWPGKVAVTLVAAYLFVAVLHSESMATVREILFWLSLASMFISTVSYGRRLFIGRNVPAAS